MSCDKRPTTSWKLGWKSIRWLRNHARSLCLKPGKGKAEHNICLYTKQGLETDKTYRLKDKSNEQFQTDTDQTAGQVTDNDTLVYYLNLSRVSTSSFEIKLLHCMWEGKLNQESKTKTDLPSMKIRNTQQDMSEEAQQCPWAS